MLRSCQKGVLAFGQELIVFDYGSPATPQPARSQMSPQVCASSFSLPGVMNADHDGQGDVSGLNAGDDGFTGSVHRDVLEIGGGRCAHDAPQV